MSKHFSEIVSLLFLFFISFPHPGFSEGPFPHRGDSRVRAELLSEFGAVKKGDSFLAGVLFQIDPGWHIYWRNPGDSGMPTSLRWQLPAGLKAGEVLWPVPQKFVSKYFTTYGYEDGVLLLTRILQNPKAGASDAYSLKVHAEWLACKEECIPGQSDLELSLRVQGASVLDKNHEAICRKTLENLPLESFPCKIQTDFLKSDILIRILFPEGKEELLEGLEFFPYGDTLIRYNAVQPSKKIKGGYELTVPRVKDSKVSSETVAGILLTASGWGKTGKRALQIRSPET